MAATAVIYDPLNLPPDEDGVQPNIELPNGLRLHFHKHGVSFGLIDPQDSRFAAIIPYEKAREAMRLAAEENQ